MKKKKLFIMLIAVVIIIGGIILYFSLKERNVIIFAYHKIVPSDIKEEYYKDNPWVDTTERFEKQMKYLYEHNYKTLSIDEYEKYKKSKKNIPFKTVMITIDDGDLGIYYEILPILKKYNFKATYFMIGDKVEKVSEEYNPSKQQFLGLDMINKMKTEYPNLNIQSHSYSMHSNNNYIAKIFDMEKNEIVDDFEKMEFLNTDVFCYPYGEHTNDVLNILAEKNYRFAFKLDKSGISSRKNDDFLIPRVGINYNTSFLNFKKWLLKAIIL